MRRYRRSMQRRRRLMWRHRRLARRCRRPRGGHLMRRYRRSIRRRRRLMRRRRQSRGASGDCGVGITPQMCNSVTYHGDMSSFSKPVTDGPFSAEICQGWSFNPKKKIPYWAVTRWHFCNWCALCKECLYFLGCNVNVLKTQQFMYFAQTSNEKKHLVLMQGRVQWLWKMWIIVSAHNFAVYSVLGVDYLLS